MFPLAPSIRNLHDERAAIWAQLDVETRAHASFPGLDLDEFREMRRRMDKRLTEIDAELTKRSVPKKSTRTSCKQAGKWRKVLTVIF